MQNSITRPACPLCTNADGTSFKFRRKGIVIYSCKRCALEFSFPQPTDTVLSSIYSSDYFLGGTNQKALERQRLLKRNTAKLYLDVIRPLVRVNNPRLLEIGCGAGDFLVEAQSCGFEVEGLEYSEHAANNANSRLGRPIVHVGSPETTRLPESTYDIIAAFDVIEHLRNPRQSLEQLCRGLKREGLIAIVTPSLNSWSRRLLGRFWMEYKTEHLTYFSKHALLQLFENTGFETAQFYPNYKSLSFEYIAAHFDRFRVPIASSAVHLIKRVLPKKLAHRPMTLVASGVMAIAKKT